MKLAVHTDELGPVFLKVTGLPHEQQPYLAFASAAVAQRFCEVASIAGAKIVPFGQNSREDQSRGLLLFRTVAQVEAYGLRPSEFPLADLIGPLSTQ